MEKAICFFYLICSLCACSSTKLIYVYFCGGFIRKLSFRSETFSISHLRKKSVSPIERNSAEIPLPLLGLPLDSHRLWQKMNKHVHGPNHLWVSFPSLIVISFSLGETDQLFPGNFLSLSTPLLSLSRTGASFSQAGEIRQIYIAFLKKKLKCV